MNKKIIAGGVVLAALAGIGFISSEVDAGAVYEKIDDNTVKVTETKTEETIVAVSDIEQEIARQEQQKAALEAEIVRIDAKLVILNNTLDEIKNAVK